MGPDSGTPVRGAKTGLTLRTVVAGAALGLLITGQLAILLASVADLRQSELRLNRSAQVQVTANQLERLIIDLETGTRGYVLTGEEQFLQPWQVARAAFPDRAATLEGLVADDPRQVALVEKITTAGESYIEDYSVPLIDTARRDPAAARSTAAALEGKQRVDAIRADFDAVMRYEQAASDAQRRRSDANARRAIVVGVAGLVGSLVLIAAYTGYVTRTVVVPVRRVAATARRLADGDLDARVPGRGAAEIGMLKGSFNTMAGTLARNRDELRASRQRIVTAGDTARRRIERDLHDGIQQRLVSFLLDVRTAQALVPPDQPELAERLARLADGLAEAVDELREISRGIHPAILSEAGLGPALKALGRRSTVPVELDMTIPNRLAEQVEVAAYYVVSEALANAAKHAQATVVSVSARVVDGVLRLEVQDDGVGGASPGQGSGLVGLTDRVEAVGGTLIVVSPEGQGTTLTVDLPVIER
jgi:signal transduction histidine kinase